MGTHSDKTTIGYTAVMGLREDTHLKGQQYSNVAMIFYIGYLAAEFPTQYLSQRISRIGKYLGANIVLWGIALAAHAACQNYAGLMVCRAILGVFEACVTPTLVLVVAMWYKKSEQGRRISYVYVCNRSGTPRHPNMDADNLQPDLDLRRSCLLGNLLLRPPWLRFMAHLPAHYRPLHCRRWNHGVHLPPRLTSQSSEFHRR